jgi:hypothetical protein
MSEIVRIDLFFGARVNTVGSLHTYSTFVVFYLSHRYKDSISHTFTLFEYSIHEFEAVNMISAVSGAWTVW